MQQPSPSIATAFDGVSAVTNGVNETMLLNQASSIDIDATTAAAAAAALAEYHDQFIQHQTMNAGAGGMADSSSKSTLWMGELDNWMDDVYIRQIWQTLGFEVQAKVIRNKQTGIHSGFAFVDFITPEAASLALSHYNGQKIPGTVKDFRLNWSNSSQLQLQQQQQQQQQQQSIMMDDRMNVMSVPGNMHMSAFTVASIPAHPPQQHHQHQQHQHQQQQQLSNAPIQSAGSEYSVFVGDLGPEVTDFMLQRLFQARYRSVKAAKVVTDPVTRASRGYGFVRFFSEIDQQMAMNEMNGVILGSRAIRVSMATPKQYTRNQSNAIQAHGLPIPSGSTALDPSAGEMTRLLGGSVTAPPHFGNSIDADQLLQLQAINGSTPEPWQQTAGAGGGGGGLPPSQHQTQRTLEPHGAIRNQMRSPLYTVTQSGGGASMSTMSPEYDPARDPYNTTIFVGGLIGPISETDLRVVFAQYGDVVYCKIPVGKGCGFVTFASRVHAETALQQLNGFIIGNSRLRLSWGRGLGRAHAATTAASASSTQAAQAAAYAAATSTNGGLTGSLLDSITTGGHQRLQSLQQQHQQQQQSIYAQQPQSATFMQQPQQQQSQQPHQQQQQGVHLHQPIPTRSIGDIFTSGSSNSSGNSSATGSGSTATGHHGLSSLFIQPPQNRPHSSSSLISTGGIFSPTGTSSIAGLGASILQSQQQPMSAIATKPPSSISQLASSMGSFGLGSSSFKLPISGTTAATTSTVPSLIADNTWLPSVTTAGLHSDVSIASTGPSLFAAASRPSISLISSPPPPPSTSSLLSAATTTTAAMTTTSIGTGSIGLDALRQQHQAALHAPHRHSLDISKSSNSNYIW